MKRQAAFAALACALLVALWLTEDGGRPGSPPAAPVPAPTSTSEMPASAPVPRGQGFDFYVLALSWSPTFCLSGEAREGDAQCARGQNRGFVVHGLWPQYERGYPEFCASPEPARVPAAIGRELAGIMPSMGLIGHQWRKHGTCTGLSQKDYFSVLAAAHGRVAMPPQFAGSDRPQNFSPDEIERAFIAANPSLPESGIAVSCAAKRLDEVRICMNTDLDFRPCPEVDRRGCGLDSITLPAAR